ncbi:MAG: right-handed parallel beta-helix repeat-containing protein [bacterium]|nr:right-handed parallel beta-helix repeat-containing protein [bacterium]
MNRIISLWMCLWLLLIISPLSAQTTEVIYYVAPNGDDNADGSESAPWRTLNRVQQAISTTEIMAGGQILFQRNGVYEGSLNLSESYIATADAPLIFGAYGEGENPIITALFPLADWVEINTNIWQTTCDNCAPRTDLLLINGNPQPKARYPNLDEEDEGYLYFDGFEGRSALIDDALVGDVDWSGGELVIRSIAWVLDRYPILDHVENRIQLGETLDETSYDFEVGYGYFLQNHPAALDREGEWVHDATNQSITLYTTTDPNTHVIQTTSTPILLDMTYTSHIIVRDLSLYGGMSYTVLMGISENITFDNVVISYSPGKAIDMTGVNTIRILNSHISNHLSNGILSWSCIECLIQNNIIENIGLLAGMGRGGDISYNGINIHGDNTLIEYNTLQYLGYNAIGIGGNVSARYNLVQYFALVKVDSGGIGTFETKDSQIIGNIVLYGLGSDAAIPWGIPAVNGIYIDDNSENIEVRDNVIGYMGENGIVLHNTKNIILENNIIFAVKNGIFIIDDDLGEYESTDSQIVNNQIFTFGEKTMPMKIESSLLDEGWLTRLGIIQGNRYCNPSTPYPIQINLHQPSYDEQFLTLPEWQSKNGYDTTSLACDKMTPIYINVEELASNRIANPNFEGHIDGWNGWPDTSLELKWDEQWDGSLQFGHVGNDSSVLAYINIGAIEANQLYRVQFRAQSQTDNTEIRLYFQQDNDPWEYLTESIRVNLSTTDQVYTVYLLTTKSDLNQRLTFELQYTGVEQYVWMDDVQVVEVRADKIQLGDVARLEMNPSDIPITIMLDEYAYQDLYGTQYAPQTTITLAPFSGIILIKK